MEENTHPPCFVPHMDEQDLDEFPSEEELREQREHMRRLLADEAALFFVPPPMREDTDE